MNASRKLLIVPAMLSLLLWRPAAAQTATAGVDLQTQGTSSSSAKGSNPTNADSGWHFALSPYLWFAGSHGSVGALGRTVGMHASPSDLLSHFDIGVMGAAEARYKRFLLNGDMLWIRLSDSHAIPFPALGALGVTSADVRVGQFLWTSKGGYRVIDRKGIKADANVGVRYWHLGQKLTFNPSLLGLNFNGSQNWADIVVGGHVQLPAGKKTVIDVAGDVGGWDATAKLDYQFLAVLGYKICPKVTLRLGYRYLFVDYRPTSLSVYSTITSGAVLGTTFNFK